MKMFRKVLSARYAFQNAETDDLLFPISEEQREQIQRIVINIYKDILRACKDIQATPFLVGGSALGAIRHKGFIPWDDDLDIGLMRDEYELFLDTFSMNYSDKYVINSAGRDKNAKVRFTKIMKRGTVCRDLTSPLDNSINGIFVDVFPIDNVPDNKLLRIIKGCSCNIIEFISSQVSYVEFGDDRLLFLLKRTGFFSSIVRISVGKLFGLKKASKWFALLDRIEQCKNDDSKYCSIIPGRKHYFGEIIERETIMPPRFVEFCSVQAPVFYNVESYLTNLYGCNYMEIPPEEKREKHMVVELDFGLESEEYNG